MKRRQFMTRVSQIAAGLGLGGWAAAKSAPAALPAVEAAPVVPDFVPMTAVAPYVRFPDLLARGIRRVYFSDYAERVIDYEPIFNRFGFGAGEPDRVIPGLGRMPRQYYLNRLKRGKPPKRRRV